MARPRFEPTTTQREAVAIAAGAGVHHEVIAQSLGISRNTLEKYFRTELNAGAAQRRLEVVLALHKAAMKGNVAAQKAYIAFGAAQAATAAPIEPPAPKFGKKERQQEAAAHVGRNGRFRPGRRPSLKVVVDGDAAAAS